MCYILSVCKDSVHAAEYSVGYLADVQDLTQIKLFYICKCLSLSSLKGCIAFLDYDNRSVLVTLCFTFIQLMLWVEIMDNVHDL